MPERTCACNCGASLDGMRSDAIYASAACRTRDWKRREGITGIRYTKASQNGKSRPSGLQLSYYKTADALVDHFGLSRTQVERIPRPVLSRRQCRLLESRPT
jgi:hypothetical protein